MFGQRHHKHTSSMTVDEEWAYMFPCVWGSQRRNNPEMILPVAPPPCCVPTWKLMEEMDHINRLPPSQQRQNGAAKRPHSKWEWGVDSSPCTSNVIHRWETPGTISLEESEAMKNTLFLFDFSKSFSSPPLHHSWRGNYKFPLEARQ